MLVLSRKAGEKILIGENISVTVVRIGPGVVRIGVAAPDDMAILREELKIAIQNGAVHNDAGHSDASRKDGSTQNGVANHSSK